MHHHAQSPLSGASRRRRAWLAALVLVLLVHLAAGTGRVQPAHAGVVLKAGDIVVGTLQNVSVLDRSTRTINVLANHPDIEMPYFVALGPDNEIYAADTYFGNPDRPTILRIDPSTGAPTVMASGGFGYIGGLAAEPGGQLLIADSSNSRIVRLNLSNGVRTTVSSGGMLNNITDLALEADGSILTTAAISPGGGVNAARRIVRIRAGSNAQEVVASGGSLTTPAFLGVGPDGSVYTSDKGNDTVPDRVIKVHPQTGAQAIMTQFDSGHLTGIKVDGSGIVYFGYIGSLDGIYRLDPATGQRERLAASNGADWPGGIAVVGGIVSCSPRPQIHVRSTNLGGGRLQVTVKATGDGNTIRSIQPGSSPVATLEAPPTIVGADASFVLRRTAPGPVTFPFTATDGCGPWNTFVGGGPNAF